MQTKQTGTEPAPFQEQIIPNEFELEVTDQDIEIARRQCQGFVSSRKCAISQALKRKFGADTETVTASDFSKIGKTLYSHDGEKMVLLFDSWVLSRKNEPRPQPMKVNFWLRQ
jgi:hypothetical protein